jgi:hypothetical protein
VKDAFMFAAAAAVAQLSAGVSIKGSFLGGFPPGGLPDSLALRLAHDARRELLADQGRICRELFGNPFRPVAFSDEWRTDTALSLARQMYESRDFSAMPILADALQDAGCDNDDILDHCRGAGPHVRGAFVVALRRIGADLPLE